MSASPVFRFAPSPNGYLHKGHAFCALYTAQWAARMGGTFRLRLEDIDPTRCKPEFADAIFEDLHWLGLDWPRPVLRQSDRLMAYQAAGRRLRNMDLIYPCFCKRADVAAHAVGTDPDGAPIYPGTCAHLTPAQIEVRLAAGETPQYRLRTTEAHRRTGPLTWTGAQPTPSDRPQIRYARPERWGDVVLMRRDTPTSYHLSVVIDDAHEGITHVTRGRDMEDATDIHVLLQMLLGLPQPIYNFHRLVLDETGQKLSKSRQSPSLRDLRAAGVTAQTLRAELGF